MIKSLLWVHIACGIAAILLGAVAVAVRKGGRIHVGAGNGFAAAMIGLGLTAAILEPFRTPAAGIADHRPVRLLFRRDLLGRRPAP